MEKILLKIISSALNVLIFQKNCNELFLVDLSWH